MKNNYTKRIIIITCANAFRPESFLVTHDDDLRRIRILKKNPPRYNINELIQGFTVAML